MDVYIEVAPMLPETHSARRSTLTCSQIQLRHSLSFFGTIPHLAVRLHWLENYSSIGELETRMKVGDR